MGQLSERIVKGLKPQKRAIIVCGSPGSGKTTYGRRLAEGLGAACLDIDTVAGRLIATALSEAGRDPAERDSQYYKHTYREPIYETVFDIARENLSSLSVVIIGPFTKEIRDIQWPSKLSKKLGAPVEVHYVYCAADERRKRLETRDLPADRLKLKEWEKLLRYYGDEGPPQFEHIYVDTSGSHL